MIVLRSCRGGLLVFLSFCLLSISFKVIASDAILLSSNEMLSYNDKLVYCELENHDVNNCFEVQTSERLVNPIAIASNSKNLFIANYGNPIFSRTSFVEKCDLPSPSHPSINCQSILAIVSASHITGLEVVGDKFYFTQSFTYGYEENVNFNYLVVCDLVEGERVPQNCGPIHLLKGTIPNPQSGVNQQMEIKVTDKNIFVSDFYGGAIFICDLPDYENAVSCKPINSKPEYILSFDVQKTHLCQLKQNKTDPIEGVSLDCCNEMTFQQNCQNSSFLQLHNPYKIKFSSDKSGLFISTHLSSTFYARPDSYFSFCELNNDEQIRVCKPIETEYISFNGKKEILGNISNIKIFKTHE